jgi:hypothetical protein
MKKTARRAADELNQSSSGKMLQIAASYLVKSWSSPDSDEKLAAEVVSNAITRTVQDQTETLRQRMDVLAHKLNETLQSAAKVLEITDVPAEEEFACVLREMPVFDLGQLTFHLRRPVLLTLLVKKASESFATKRLTALIGAQLSRSLSAYRALLYDWSDRTLGQVQRRFDAYANSYRAQVERLLGNQEMRAGQDEDSIRRDLESLENTLREKTLAS